MKTIKLTILCLTFPLTFFAQSLTGLWMGAVSNDSTTIRKDQSFEIVLTQYKDKVYGYSRSTFIVHDTLFYIVKRVKGTIEGDICEVKDDKIVSHNFPGRVDKGVKMISTFRFNSNDSTWHLDGDWKTNKTKKYYSVSGKISLKSEPNIELSKIFPHLEELKLADDVAFYKESKKEQQPVAVIKDTKKDELVKNTPKREPVTEPRVQTRKDMMAKKEETASTSPKTAPVTETKQPIKDIPKETVALTTIETKKPEEKVSVKQEQKNPVATISKPVEEKKETIKPSTTVEEKVIKEDPKNSVATISKPTEEKKETTKPSTTVEQKVAKEEPKNSVATISKPVEQKKEIINTPVIEEKKPVPAAPIAAAMIKERKIAPPQIVNYKSDTLELSLYDNGEVDGDTVSVLFNGEILLAKQGLKASAIKKTIYIPANRADSSTLVLYAENLGKYPPNTGLLIVRDGEETYQIRFSADLNQNAAVIFKRKRN